MKMIMEIIKNLPKWSPALTCTANTGAAIHIQLRVRRIATINIIINLRLLKGIVVNKNIIGTAHTVMLAYSIKLKII
jgi:hypothetical protein